MSNYGYTNSYGIETIHLPLGCVEGTPKKIVTKFDQMPKLCLLFSSITLIQCNRNSYYPIRSLTLRGHRVWMNQFPFVHSFSKKKIFRNHVSATTFTKLGTL